ncbi:MAG: low molecular weight protein-tyrosine-phosphatase [Planctomycetota bacterium]
MQKQLHISFICSGNICRSPYAEALLRDRADEEGWGDQIRVTSAGTLGIQGCPAHATTIACGGKKGLNLVPHRSQCVTEEYLASCDIILGVDRSHVLELRHAFPAHAARVFLYRSYPEPHLDGGEIGDPIGTDEENFRGVFKEIEEGLPSLLTELRRLLGVEPGIAGR